MHCINQSLPSMQAGITGNSPHARSRATTCDRRRSRIACDDRQCIHVESTAEAAEASSSSSRGQQQDVKERHPLPSVL
eukprot:6185249-Pleurochrysis_carterae.AAC.4